MDNKQYFLSRYKQLGETITDAGGPTLPGTYMFDVYVDYITNSEATDEYEKLLLTVQIAE